MELKTKFSATAFANANPKVTFPTAKGVTAPASFNGNGSSKDEMEKVQVKLIWGKSGSSGADFLRLQVIDRREEGKEKMYFGALFHNDKKEGNQSDFYGNLNLKDGSTDRKDQLRIAAWNKKSEKNGNEYLSLAFSEHQVKPVSDDGDSAADNPEPGTNEMQEAAEEFPV